MSPKGRPTQAKKDKRFEIRLTSETYSTLEECAERLNLSKAQVIHKGIELVKENLDKNRALPPQKVNTTPYKQQPIKD